MEDLDALLADLQNSTARISSSHNKQGEHQQRQASQQHHQWDQQQHQQWDHQQQWDQHRQHQWDQQQQHQWDQQQQHQWDQPQLQRKHCLPILPYQHHQQSPTDTYEQGSSNNYFSIEPEGIYELQQRTDHSPATEVHAYLDYSQDSQSQAAFKSQFNNYSDKGYSQTVVNVTRESYCSSGDNSGGSTPPPLPPPPSSDILDGIAFSKESEHPVYEPQTFHVRESTPSTSSNNSIRAAAPHGSRARDRGDRMSALSSNLSELDQLLQDLNSAQFMAEVDRKSSRIITLLNYLEDQSDDNTGVNEVTVNGGVGKQPTHVAPKPASKSVLRSSVDNLLDELEGTGHPPGRFPLDPHYQELSTVTSNHSQYQHNSPYIAGVSSSSSSSYHHQQNTSTATRELDELMMSLSEFKMQNKGGDDLNEPAYAKPVKSRTASTSSPTTPHGMGPGYHQIQEQRQQYHQHQQHTQRENGLDVMLGDLQSDMNRQGVNVKQKGVCAACQKPIVGQVIAALGRTWHVEHFVCAHCEEPLGTKNFYERDSLAYCETDYHHLFAPRCAYCNGPIVDKCITALEKMWHPEHFFCAQCGRPFGEEDFHEKNGKAYCREDYFQMFAPKCGGCAQPIMENYISALNRQWHPECFVCWECRSTFGAGSFFDYEGLPYCETHYHAKKGSLCASCERPITGRCITAMFKKFHPEHFVCAFCLKQLNKGTFKEQNDKPYCHPCFVKLFG
ncbi:hypothetical protein BsWGS_21359 [Bradybaena similaris]